MLNATDSSDVTFYGMRDLVDVKMDFTLHAVDKLTLVVCFFAILTDGAVFVTLGKLPQVKNYCPVRLLQILAVYQIVWGILQGVEDPKLRPLDSMVPDFVPRDVACKVNKTEPSLWKKRSTTKKGSLKKILVAWIMKEVMILETVKKIKFVSLVFNINYNVFDIWKKYLYFTSRHLAMQIYQFKYKSKKKFWSGTSYILIFCLYDDLKFKKKTFCSLIHSKCCPSNSLHLWKIWMIIFLKYLQTIVFYQFWIFQKKTYTLEIITMW